MLKPGERADFADEADLPGLRCRIRVQDFEGHLSFVLEVAGEVHRGVCTLADFSADLIASLQRDAKRSERIDERHRGAFARLRHLKRCPESSVERACAAVGGRNSRATTRPPRPAKREEHFATALDDSAQTYEIPLRGA